PAALWRQGRTEQRDRRSSARARPPAEPAVGAARGPCSLRPPRSQRVRSGGGARRERPPSSDTPHIGHDHEPFQHPPHPRNRPSSSACRSIVYHASSGAMILDDPYFDAQWLRTAGHSGAGGAELGECLSVAGAIRGSDIEGWYAAWLAMGERVLALADESRAAGRDVSARGAYL